MILYLKQVFVYVFQELVDTSKNRRFLVWMITLLPPELLRAARALTGLSQAEVAVLADVSQKTLSQMEAGKVASAALVEKLRKFYESQDIEFIASRDSGRAADGIGVRMRPERPDVGVRII